MKYRSFRLSAAVIAALAVYSASAAARDVRMQERYNVGEYIEVGKTDPYRLRPHASPRPLTRRSPDEMSAGDRAAVAAAEAYLEKYPETTGFLLVDRGRIIFDGYQGMGGPEREFYGMSIGKSLTSLAVGRALCAGALPGLDVAAGTYVPEMAGSNFGKSTVRQLLTMSSGAYRSKGKAGGQPDFGGKLLGKYAGVTWPMRLGKLTVEEMLWGWVWAETRDQDIHPPGERFIYKSGDTLALAKTMERATGTRLAAYFDQTVWRSVRAAHRAHWESDSTGSALAHAGFQARLSDWGRLAVWLLEERAKPGCYGDYLRAATVPQITTGSGAFRGYGYQWWTDHKSTPGFWSLGYAGQAFGMDPDSGKVLAKFGYAKYGRTAGDLFRIFQDWVASGKP
jgi:CubicO group peptidase (beta-lactamase class C family)